MKRAQGCLIKLQPEGIIPEASIAKDIMGARADARHLVAHEVDQRERIKQKNFLVGFVPIITNTNIYQ